MTIQTSLFDRSLAKASMVSAQTVAAAEQPNERQLLVNFEVVAEAVGSTSKLRQLILLLAVTGRLSQRWPGDGDAGAVLKTLNANDVRTSTEGREDSDLDDATGPVTLPSTWRWARFLHVASIDSHLVDPAGFQDAPHVAPDNIEKGTGRLLEYRTIREDGVTSSKHRFFAGQIVYSKIRPNLSKAVVVDFEGLCSADMYPLTAKIDRGFLHCFLLSRVFLDQVVKEDNRLAMPKVNQEQLGATVVPVPPLAEQKRIVARVEQLMALIDDLEAKQTRKREVSARFTKASLEALTTAEGPEEFDAAWKRVVENWETLLDRSEKVSELRKATLELAVRGVLTRTEPDDDNANETLGSLPLTSGRRSRGGANDEVVPTRTFLLRETWAWCTLERLVDPDSPVSYGVLVPGPEVDDGVPFVRIQDLSVNAPPAQPAKRIAASVAKQYERTKLEGGEILLGVVGSIGKVGIAPPSWAGAAIARAVCRIMPSPQVDPLFLAWVIQSPLLQRYFLDSTRTLAQPTLNVAMIRAAPIPLPPLAEQKRIVAKVEHLMKLCDDLEAKLRRAEDRASKLVEAVVQEMVA